VVFDIMGTVVAQGSASDIPCSIPYPLFWFKLFQVVLVLHQMRVLLLNGSLPEKAPLAEVSEERSQVSTSATRIGSEVDLGELRKIF
jgi:hypothetical protein